MSESMVAAHRMAWATYIRARAIASWKTITNRTVRKVFILLTLLARLAKAGQTCSRQDPDEEQAREYHACHEGVDEDLTK